MAIDAHGRIIARPASDPLGIGKISRNLDVTGAAGNGPFAGKRQRLVGEGTMRGIGPDIDDAGHDNDPGGCGAQSNGCQGAQKHFVHDGFPLILV